MTTNTFIIIIYVIIFIVTAAFGIYLIMKSKSPEERKISDKEVDEKCTQKQCLCRVCAEDCMRCGLCPKNKHSIVDKCNYFR